MELFGTSVYDILRAFVGVCEVPVIVLLLLFMAVVLICVGSLIGELILEHRHFRVFLPRLVDELRASVEAGGSGTRDVIKESGLLLRQKQFLTELTRHEDVGDEMRESLAAGLDYQEQRLYDRRLKVTDMIARLAPMLGLLGTLIPLGPGIMALSEGDTASLSASLLTAFDTTSMGLMIAGVALIVSAIRKRWYRDYMVSFDAAMECVLEVEKQRTSQASR